MCVCVCAHSEVRFAANVGLSEGVDGLRGDTKVTELHLTCPVYQNVRRLHICSSVCVCVCECILVFDLPL